MMVILNLCGLFLLWFHGYVPDDSVGWCMHWYFQFRKPQVVLLHVSPFFFFFFCWCFIFWFLQCGFNHSDHNLFKFGFDERTLYNLCICLLFLIQKQIFLNNRFNLIQFLFFFWQNLCGGSSICKCNTKSMKRLCFIATVLTTTTHHTVRATTTAPSSKSIIFTTATTNTHNAK